MTNLTNMEITLARHPSEIQEILKIQRENHVDKLPDQLKIQNGFVTAVHRFEDLEKMNAQTKQVIAKVNNEVVGYALVMPKEFKDLISVLLPLFEMIERIEYEGRKLSELNYYVMGQICIQSGYRRQGIFTKLYQKHKEQFSNYYDYCITGVSSSNLPSIKAHEKIGFKTVHTFRDHLDEWNIILWDWS